MKEPSKYTYWWRTNRPYWYCLKEKYGVRLYFWDRNRSFCWWFVKNLQTLADNIYSDIAEDWANKHWWKLIDKQNAYYGRNKES